MKCPRCGSEMTTNKKCVTCGSNAPYPQGEIEVDYKDFKISELLEIRRKMQTAPSAAEAKIIKEYQGRVPKSTAAQKISPCDEKNSFPILAVAILILMLIAGAFLLVRNIIPH